MNSEIERHPEVDGQRYLSDASVWRSVSAFEFRLPPLQSLSGQWLSSLAFIAGWLIVGSFVLTLLAQRESGRRA